MTASPILATRKLGLDIGGATIVADVELEVLDGELLAVIGPNGAGKTTLFNLVSGLRRPTSGTIELDGVDITEQPPYRRAKAGIGRTFQVSNVFPLLSVHENVRLSAEAAMGGTMRIWRRAIGVRDAIGTPPDPHRPADASLGSEPRVLERGQPREDARDLERPADARLRAPVWRRAGDVTAVELDRAARRPVQTGQQVEQRRLPGAVRPDDSQELALGHLERDIGDDCGAADVEPEIPGREDWRGRAHLVVV